MSKTINMFLKIQKLNVGDNRWMKYSIVFEPLFANKINPLMV